jgi:transposase
MDPMRDFIDAILRADRAMPRKHRHTARRIRDRIIEEKGLVLAESTVRRHVRLRKEQLGFMTRETCIPQTYAPGQEAQVDWYEAWAELDGEMTEIQVFSMRSMYSGAAFHKAYLRATQQALLEAHEEAFAYFGGLFKTLRYDNLKAVVKKILRGHQREETERFIAFRSHWGFLAEFCNVESGNEKGGVEGEVGYFRRNNLTPIIRAHDLADLNTRILAGCRKDEYRMIGGRKENAGILLLGEREHLLPPVGERFDLSERSNPRVDGLGRVKVRTNWYSAPIATGRRVEVKLHADRLEILFEGRVVARHERCYGRGEEILNLEHYLDVLARKPGALANSTPLWQWRAQGRWPACLDTLWAALEKREGRLDGTKRMIEVLQAGRDYGWENLKEAVERLLEVGIIEPSAIRQQAGAEQWERSQLGEPLEVDALVRYERPMPDVSGYDDLIMEAAS